MALARSCNSGLSSLLRRGGAVGHDCSPVLQLPFSSKPDVVDSSAEKEKERKKKKKNTNTSVVKEDEVKPLLKPSSLESGPDSALIKSLKRQLKEATKLTNKFQTEVRGSFKPFEVVLNDGASDLTLRRIIGKEEILVKCLLDLENVDKEDQTESATDGDGSDSDDFEELGISQRVTMNVKISKNSSKEDQPGVAFLCTYAKGEKLCIEDIAYFGGSIDKHCAYSGPYFPDLSSNLRQTFQTVIKTRGINSSLADTIIEHLSVQYQNEYLDWLKKLGDFLAR